MSELHGWGDAKLTKQGALTWCQAALWLAPPPPTGNPNTHPSVRRHLGSQPLFLKQLPIVPKDQRHCCWRVWFVMATSEQTRTEHQWSPSLLRGRPESEEHGPNGLTSITVCLLVSTSSPAEWIPTHEDQVPCSCGSLLFHRRISIYFLSTRYQMGPHTVMQGLHHPVTFSKPWDGFDINVVKTDKWISRQILKPH